MTGARYDGWMHTHVVGDRAAASQYLPAARKVMGYVMQEAERGNLGTVKHRTVLDDGTVIVGELHGKIPRVTITPPPVEGEEVPPTPLEDFVVWARDETHLGGIDPPKPEQILRFQDKEWRTFFNSGSTPGHDEFDGAKGTYVVLFPEGVKHAGNIDWVGKKQVRISWYGPSSRYWPDAYVQPRSQFGKFVFSMGAVVLNTDAYATASTAQVHGDDRYVLGAALKNIDGVTWLYTVQSEAANEPAPSTDAPGRAANCRPYTLTDNPGGLYRYRLLKATDAAGVPRYTVASNSRQLLLALNDNHAEPWFFNESVTAAHCYVLPPGYYTSHYPDFTVGDPPPGPTVLPDPDQLFRSVSIDDTTAGLNADITLHCTANGAPVQVASDYKGDVRVHATVRFASFLATPPGGVVYWDVAGTEFNSNGLVDNVGYWTSIVFADLRTDVLILRSNRHDYTAGAGTGQRIEVFRTGLLEGHVQIADDFTGFIPGAWTYSQLSFAGQGGVPNWMDGDDTAGGFASTYVLPPYFFVYGVYSRYLVVDDLVQMAYLGVNASYGWLAYPSAHYFGATYIDALVESDTGTTIASKAPGGFQGNAADFDGHYSVTGCASNKDVVMLSTWRPDGNPFASGWGLGNNTTNYVTDDDLRDLTGVIGTYARFHPIWLLGKPPTGVSP